MPKKGLNCIVGTDQGSYHWNVGISVLMTTDWLILCFWLQSPLKSGTEVSWKYNRSHSKEIERRHPIKLFSKHFSVINSFTSTAQNPVLLSIISTWPSTHSRKFLSLQLSELEILKMYGNYLIFWVRAFTLHRTLESDSVTVAVGHFEAVCKTYPGSLGDFGEDLRSPAGGLNTVCWAP